VIDGGKWLVLLPARFNPSGKATGEDINTIKKNREFILEASKEVAVDVKKERTKCRDMFLHQNAGQNRYLIITNKSFQNMANFKYLGTTVRNVSEFHSGRN